MTQTNEEMLLRALAKKHLGDTAFCKKYGLSISNEAEKLLAPYAEKVSEYPPEEILDRVNNGFEQEFLFAVKDKLESTVSEDFINDLVFDSIYC